MNLFRFLRRPIRTSVPAAQPVQPAEVARDAPEHVPAPVPVPSPPTPHEIRRLVFDAVASGDESRLHALCKEHEDLIIQQSDAWLDVPAEFRTSPELREWYGNGLRAIREYCAERSARHDLTDDSREVLDVAPTGPMASQDHGD